MLLKGFKVCHIRIRWYGKAHKAVPAFLSSKGDGFPHALQFAPPTLTVTCLTVVHLDDNVIRRIYTVPTLVYDIQTHLVCGLC
jgi:hypothetical protein